MAAFCGMGAFRVRMKGSITGFPFSVVPMPARVCELKFVPLLVREHASLHCGNLGTASPETVTCLLFLCLPLDDMLTKPVPAAVFFASTQGEH
jgi:hypothetical protein